MQDKKLIYIIVGARPNFMKVAPMIREIERGGFKYKLIHTGQHYDKNMSDVFFKQIGIPDPDINMNIHEGSVTRQNSQVMVAFEKICVDEMPDMLIVVGDVNPTFATSFVANKLGIKVSHVEAGLRSFDNGMPEEINRLLTDRISDYLFITEESAVANLCNEGIGDDKVFMIGNLMIDSLIYQLDKIDTSNIYNRKYGLITMHRPSNVDEKDKMLNFIKLFSELTLNNSELDLIFPMHPRTKKMLEEFNLLYLLEENEQIKILPPQGYNEFISLIKNSAFVLTDSGGIQEETTYLKVPCITLRENTERPITITHGSNTLVGSNMDLIKDTLVDVLNGKYKNGEDIPMWDGNAAVRLMDELEKILNK